MSETLTSPADSPPGSDVRRYQMYVGGEWVDAQSGELTVPFGGFGQSGIGRENGIEGLLEYTQTKAVWVELSGETRDPFTLG